MKKIILALMLLSTITTFSQERKVRGNKNIISKDKKVQKYNKVLIGNGIDLMIMANSILPEVNITADANLHQIFEISVKDELLTIKIRDGIEVLNQTENFKVSITNKDLDKITVLGNSRVESMGVLETNNLEIEVMESGMVTPQIKTQELKLSNKGSGTIALTGKTNNVYIKNQGSGLVDLSKVTSFFTEVHLEGSGDVYTRAINGLDGKLKGSGNIYYENTEILNIEITGSGQLISK